MTNPRRSKDSLEHPYTVLSTRLLNRRSEIEEALLARVHAVVDSAGKSDSEYLHGLRISVSKAVDCSLLAVTQGEKETQSIPVTLLSQARLAARNNVSLHTVLRHYFASYRLLSDFILDEARQDNRLQGSDLILVLRSQGALFERILTAVEDEYAREKLRCQRSSDARRAEYVQRLLAGEPLNTSHLEYNFEANHCGVVASGTNASRAIRDLAQALDRKVLVIHPGGDTVWAWLSSELPIERHNFDRALAKEWPNCLRLSIGEQERGFAGWRITHQQAKAAFRVALGKSQPIARYADVALLSSMLRDKLLVTSLQNLYLTPLADGRDGGAAFRATLRAYFAANRNSSSAAAALGVSRQTVSNRLRAIEERLGRPLSICATDIEAALRLADAAGPR